MTKKLTYLPFACLMLLSSVIYGQKSSGVDKLPSIGVHGGVLSYLGDIKGSKGSTLYTYWRPGYGFYLEKKIGSIFGISVNGLFGKISKSQLDEQVFANFETSVFNADINLLLDFDNGKIINESSLFAPYFSVGFGFLSFNPKGDLRNSSGSYYHWSDGTLRDVAESTPGADTTSNVVIRDYSYESELKDSTTNYAKTSFTLPIRFGLKFKLSQNVDARIGVAYILTFTDYLDNIKAGGNDKMFYTSFGLQYNFATHEAKDDRYKDFDFSSLDKIDSDEDGVKDDDDLCQNTPKGVKVNSKGCPLDGDKDGVPDYKDKEPNTPEGTVVNSDGVTLTDEMIAQRESMKDSVEVERRVFKADDLTKEELDAIQREFAQENSALTGANIPDKYKQLDTDKDNFISAKEVTNAIDLFFEGEINLTAKDLHELIDFYFEQ